MFDNNTCMLIVIDKATV